MTVCYTNLLFIYLLLTPELYGLTQNLE